MIATLHIVRYPAFLGWAGFLSMAIFRLPLWLNRKISFYKLMGCGKNGSFDKTPDLRQWALLLASDNENITTPAMIKSWWQFFGCEIWELELEPIEGHGTWDQKAVFGNLPKQTAYEGPICVLTRATIRLSQLGRFWSHVDAIAGQMAGAKGFITSIGIGEVPWIKQATFSIWDSKTAMKEFAYKMQEHASVIKKTYQEKWYSEDMFIRFRPIKSTGSLKGRLPFEIKL
ncbi:MAG: hypothetical protein RI983_51 [Bacteroidota bacterium]|jgi:hypothetical protein